mmetsp:Transcript_21321/g.32395  ORF Transcript_21321/g.32395 Transcript_21321/m.32395 type:complete len:211 (-) Transcript_21321:1108-1740(-)
MPVALVCPFPTSVRRRVTFVVPMVPRTVSYPCSACSTILPDMSIREVESVREALLLIWNHGMPMSMPFWIYVKIMEMKTNAPVICFMPSGSPICSWNASRPMVNGRSCVPMNVQDWMIATEMNSMHFIQSMRRRGRDGRRSRRRVYGLPFWIRRWRRERHTCCSRIIATINRIRRIWVRSSVPICVRRLWSIRHRMRLRFVTWPVLVCLN